MAKNVNKIAEALGATVIGEVPDTGGGAFGMSRLAAILRTRLEPGQGRRPGRPSDPLLVNNIRSSLRGVCIKGYCLGRRLRTRGSYREGRWGCTTSNDSGSSSRAAASHRAASISEGRAWLGEVWITGTSQTSPTHTARVAGRHKTGRPADPRSPAPTQT